MHYDWSALGFIFWIVENLPWLVCAGVVAICLYLLWKRGSKRK